MSSEVSDPLPSALTSSLFSSTFNPLRVFSIVTTRHSSNCFDKLSNQFDSALAAPIVHFSLFTIHFSLFTIHFSLFTK